MKILTAITAIYLVVACFIYMLAIMRMRAEYKQTGVFSFVMLATTVVLSLGWPYVVYQTWKMMGRK